MLRGNDCDAVQMDMLDDNVEALVSGEVYYLVGILGPW